MNDDIISRSALRARFQEILDRGDMFCEYDIIGMVDNAPPADVMPFAIVKFDKDELTRIVDERIIEPIKNGELVIQTEERPQSELANEVWKLYEKHHSHLATHVIEFGDELKELLGKYQKGGAENE